MSYRQLNEKRGFGLLFFFLTALIISTGALFAEDRSLSDLSLESFLGKTEDSQSRNPFAPGAVEEALNPLSLGLQGIVYSQNIKLCLVADKILREGDIIGGFLVKTIRPGSVLIQSYQGVTKLNLATYLPQAGPLTDYEITFENADLKQSLQLLAAAGNFNLIVPESLSGRVTLLFHKTPLKDALASILGVNKLESAEENNIIRVGDPKDFAAGSYFKTRHITLRYASAKTLIETVKAHLSSSGTVSADERTNTLILKDSQSVLDNALTLITSLDRPDTQVRIEAKVIDVTRTFSRALGIQWGFTRTDRQITGFGVGGVGSTDSGNNANVNLGAASPTSGVGILIGSLFDGTDLEAQISAAEEKGDIHIISQPSITTINNTPATIRSGVKIYVKALVATEGSTSDDGLQEIDTGIELTVTPQITIDGMVKLTIQAEESEADFSRTVDGIPAVIDNRATTTVLVRDGETTVIGGMLKINKSNTVTRVPFLSSIPVFGWLFKSKAKQKDDNELLIFISPHIVKQSEVSSNPAVYEPSIHEAPEQKIYKKTRKSHKMLKHQN